MSLATITMAAIIPGFLGFAGVTLVRDLMHRGSSGHVALGIRRILAPLRRNRR